MDWSIAILYGLIQGISEFLPVSSSGHLALLPYFLNVKDPGVFFDLMMHVGTALAVVFYFWKELIEYLKRLPLVIFQKAKKWDETTRLVWHFIVATLASALVIFPIKDLAATYARDPFPIAINLAFFGLLLWISDRLSSSKSEIEMTKVSAWRKALIIGLAQGFAVFPGVSRSGITITAARYLKIDRYEAASFSFILSLPIILGGALLKAKEVNWDQGLDYASLGWGVMISFFSGLLCIHYFLKLVRKISFLPFFIYRAGLAVVLLSLVFSSPSFALFPSLQEELDAKAKVSREHIPESRPSLCMKKDLLSLPFTEAVGVPIAF